MASHLIDNLERKSVGGCAGPGRRVVRGVDWGGGNADGLEGGTGNGTVVRRDESNGVAAVKWDNGNYGFYKMGAGGKFELKIAPSEASEVIERLGEKKILIEHDEEDEYVTDDEDNENVSPVTTRLLSTEHECEVCGSLWAERVRKGEKIIFRCIKHRKDRLCN